MNRNSSSGASPRSRSLRPPSALRVFLALVAFRLANALSLRTFFQPDEFFQSLEPAWHVAFGESQGAWITWEWKHHLRSSIHPLLFSAVYSTTDLAAQVLHLSAATRADLLIAAPKVTQAVIAAVGDFYTWRLAGLVYGYRSREAWAALALTVVSPWQWFCSTRTLSNCLENTITIVGLCLWPWEWSTSRPRPRDSARKGDRDWALIRLRQCLCLAALACILRPTNILIWATLASVAWFRSSWATRKVLAREVLICGSTVLFSSTLLDRLFYGVWAFPPLRFLYFNIVQSLSVFYGKNDWHYYVSQGYPLLLTTALPFTAIGLYRALTRRQSNGGQASMQVQLGAICLVMPLTLSLISHKEVRFIYPLLPSLHVLTAPTLVNFFLPAVARSSGSYTPRRLTLVFLLLANFVIALYTTLYHASGTVEVLSYLREQHQSHNPDHGITAGFLMPCHSTPWRSHLVYPNLRAWALSCNPPVDLTDSQKAVYVDEADQFYDQAGQFLRTHMGGGLRHVPRKPSYITMTTNPSSKSIITASGYQQKFPHDWPDYLVFFAQLEPTLKPLLRSSSYAECHRTFNSAWHDDWRRRGDIVVWCLDATEQQAWRSVKRKRDLESRDRHFDRIIRSWKRESSSSSPLLSFMWKWSPSRLWTTSTQSSWSWPWERRRRTWLGIPLPSWLDTSSRYPSWLNWSGWKKKKSRIDDLEYWS